MVGDLSGSMRFLLCRIERTTGKKVGSAPLSNILHKGRSDSGVSCFLNFILFQEVSFMEDFAPERVCPRCSSRVPATSPCPRCGTPPPPSRPAPTSSPDADPSRHGGPEPTHADSSWSGGPEPAPPYEEPSWRGQPESVPSSSYRDFKAAASSSAYDDSSWEPRTGWVPGRRRRMSLLVPLVVVVLGGALLAWVLM